MTQGNGSSVAFALSDAIAKNNRRAPSQAVLYLNYAAVDPGLTNEKCNWWHFRFDADSDMKMRALTDYLVGEAQVKKVYLFNPDYSFGQSVEKAAQAMLANRRADLQIVGVERVPLGKVKDFTPYVQKMQAGRRRRGDHRQLGRGPRAAVQGGAGRGLQGDVLHLLHGFVARSSPGPAPAARAMRRSASITRTSASTPTSRRWPPRSRPSTTRSSSTGRVAEPRWTCWPPP